MRVLWFSNTPGLAGDYLSVSGMGGGWLKSLERALKDHIELHVAFYYPRYSEDFQYQGIHYYPICNKNWKWEIIKKRIWEKEIDTEDVARYQRIISQVKPDLIHVHGTENPFGCIFDEVNVPVVVSIQGNIAVIHHKYFSGIERKKLFKRFFQYRSLLDFPFFVSFKTSYHKFAKMREREAKNLKNCQYVIGRTLWDKRITRVMAPKSNYYRGEELLRSAFYQQQWKQKTDRTLILHTTNGNSPYKGFETICKALSLLNMNGVEVVWRVAGINESDHIVKVVKAALGRDYPSKGLVFLGGLDERELVEKLLEADMYIMPSHIENSPNNLCEAMILGMPCIATFAGGTGSLLKDGEEGILIQDGDPWALAGAIMEIKSNPDMAIDMGRKARIRALVRHDPASVTKQYLTIYKDIINKHNK